LSALELKQESLLTFSTLSSTSIQTVPGTLGIITMINHPPFIPLSFGPLQLVELEIGRAISSLQVAPFYEDERKVGNQGRGGMEI